MQLEAVGQLTPFKKLPSGSGLCHDQVPPTLGPTLGASADGRFVVADPLCRRGITWSSAVTARSAEPADAGEGADACVVGDAPALAPANNVKIAQAANNAAKPFLVTTLYLMRLRQGVGGRAVGLETAGVSALVVGPDVDTVIALGQARSVPGPGRGGAEGTHQVPAPGRVLEPGAGDGAGGA